MADYEFPQAPEIEDAYRAAHRALLGIIPRERTLGGGEEGLHLSELISHLPALLDEAEMTVAAQLGPLASWRAPRRDGGWELAVAGIDLDDSGEHDFGDVELGTALAGLYKGPGGGWNDSALDRAARAYKREAGWDFAPGESGLWILVLAPVHGFGGGGDRSWLYSGHVVGFVILHDRDDDGEYESVAHIWTASAWRRRGIARRLMAEARARFPVADVEGPYTEDGGAFLQGESGTR